MATKLQRVSELANQTANDVTNITSMLAGLWHFFVPYKRQETDCQVTDPSYILDAKKLLVALHFFVFCCRISIKSIKRMLFYQAASKD